MVGDAARRFPPLWCVEELCATITKHRLVYPLAEEQIMANVSKVILAAVIAAVSIASPALARSHHSAHDPFRIYNYSGGDGTSLVQVTRRGDLWEGGGP
jgi:hypothetical protein